ncbi:MAG: hypothetical protein FJ405_07970 [Verrucomicrobia bacterium]|nr:hypothetical protein [Verrucomicrobiota bacterium]
MFGITRQFWAEFGSPITQIAMELRCPSVFHKVLEFEAGLHPELKVKGGQLKRALKAALSECVPAEILNRKKTGFPVPYGRWMRHELKERVWSDILDSSGLLHTHMKRSAVESFLKSTETDTSCDKELFGLWVLSLWEKEFLNNPLLSLGDENKEGKLRAAG